MVQAAGKTNVEMRREADQRFFEEFEKYILECIKTPGFKLETELQLASRFGVTRYKVRKAIAKLNTTGILTRKKHGGSTVTPIDESTLTEKIDFQFQLAGYSDDEYADSASWMFASIVPALCERITPRTVSDLYKAVDAVEAAMGDADKTAEALKGFFRLFLGAAGNRIMSVFCLVLGERAASSRTSPVFVSEKSGKELVGLLKDLVKEIKKNKQKKALDTLESIVELLFEEK